MTDKICLITGATSGIGKATAAALAKMGAKVIVNGKDEENGKIAVSEITQISGNKNVELMIADLSSLKEVRKFADNFQKKYQKLDVLINNAAVIYSSFEYSSDGIEMQFAINHLGHFLLTNLLLDNLAGTEGSRIINVSSNAHFKGKIDFDKINSEKNYFGWRVYCQSKLANVLFTYELARKIAQKKVTVNCLHPGVVKTRLVNKHVSLLYQLVWNLQKPLMLSVDKGAETSIYLASSPEVAKTTAKYFNECKPIKSSNISYNKELAAKLWDLSEELTGFKFQ